MNRKLHNSMLAFSATGLVLVFALIAASPVLPGQYVSTPVALAASTPAVELNAGLQENNKALAARVRPIHPRPPPLPTALPPRAPPRATLPTPATSPPPAPPPPAPP